MTLCVKSQQTMTETAKCSKLSGIITATIVKTANEWKCDPIQMTSCTICTSIFTFFVNIGLMMAY